MRSFPSKNAQYASSMTWAAIRVIRGVFIVASLTALFSIPVIAQTAVTPVIGPGLTPALVPINTGPGSHYHPHVDGDLVSYTSDADVRVYNFADGTDFAVPSNVQNLISDVQGGRIVYSSVFPDGHTGIVYYVPASPAIEIDPQQGIACARFSATIGGNTIAYADYTYNPGGAIVVYDLTTGISTQLTNGVSDFEPNLSPDGNTLVWSDCASGSFTGCGFGMAVRGSNGAWTVSAISNAVGQGPTTNGSVVVYSGQPSTGNNSDIYIHTIATGTTVRLDLPNSNEIYPRIAANYVVFESRLVGNSVGDIYLYDTGTNALYNLTNTPSVNEELNDITVLPDGRLRVVWDNNEAGSSARHVYGATFTLPGCVPRSYTLNAAVSYPPLTYTDALVTPQPPFTFALPGVLPVASGNAGQGYAAILFKLGTQSTVLCGYQGADGGKEYDLIGCLPSGLPSGSPVTADYIFLRVISGQIGISRTGTYRGGASVSVTLGDATCNW